MALEIFLWSLAEWLSIITDFEKGDFDSDAIWAQVPQADGYAPPFIFNLMSLGAIM